MTLDRAIEIVYEVLPNSIDQTPSGEFVCDNSSYGDKDYFDNSAFSLKVIMENKDSFFIEYHSTDNDDKEYLDDSQGDLFQFREINDEVKFKHRLIAMFSETFDWIEKFEQYK